MITKAEFLKLEDRFKNIVYRNTMIMKYIEFNLHKIKLSNDEIQELIDYFEEIEDYELCSKLQKHLINQ
jgi:hypothetical protein